MYLLGTLLPHTPDPGRLHPLAQRLPAGLDLVFVFQILGASVGPKSRYSARTIAIACCSSSAARRWFDGRPRNPWTTTPSFCRFMRRSNSRTHRSVTCMRGRFSLRDLFTIGLVQPLQPVPFAARGDFMLIYPPFSYIPTCKERSETVLLDQELIF
jgi:hypothetical protein